MFQTSLDFAANIGSNYPESAGTEKTVFEGRSAIADFLKAQSPRTIVAGESATGLLGRLSYAIGKETSANDNVVST
jgi:selenocysteine lyase/cysteine desulfurase